MKGLLIMGKFHKSYESFKDREERRQSGEKLKKDFSQILKESKEREGKATIDSLITSTKNSLSGAQKLRDDYKSVFENLKAEDRKQLERRMNIAEEILDSIEDVKKQALDEVYNTPLSKPLGSVHDHSAKPTSMSRLYDNLKYVEGLRIQMQIRVDKAKKRLVNKREQLWESSLDEGLKLLTQSQREQEFQRQRIKQEELMKNCLDTRNTSDNVKAQEAFNVLAHRVIKEDEDVKFPIYNQENLFGIEQTLSIKELIEEVVKRKRNSDTTYQKLREAVESGLAARYHTIGFADGGFAERTYFSEEPDEIDDETYEAVHNILTKAVKSYLDKELQ